MLIKMSWHNLLSNESVQKNEDSFFWTPLSHKTDDWHKTNYYNVLQLHSLMQNFLRNKTAFSKSNQTPTLSTHGIFKLCMTKLKKNHEKTIQNTNRNKLWIILYDW
jgi:hypothetical protein